MTEREDGGIYDFLCLSGSLYAPLLRTLRRLAYPVGKVVEVVPQPTNTPKRNFRSQSHDYLPTPHDTPKKRHEAGPNMLKGWN